MALVALVAADSALATPNRHCGLTADDSLVIMTRSAVVYSAAMTQAGRTPYFACWRASGRRTRLGSTFRLDSPQQDSLFQRPRFSGPFLALAEIGEGGEVTGDNQVRVDAWNLRTGRTRYCATVGSNFNRADALRLNDRGDTAAIASQTVSGLAAPISLVVSYDHRGLHTLAMGAFGQFTHLRISRTRVFWTDRGSPRQGALDQGLAQSVQ